MNKNYFIYNGVKYEYGTIILTRRFNSITKSYTECKATFCYHIVNKDLYVCKIGQEVVNYTCEAFYNSIIDITKEVDIEYVTWINRRQSINNKSLTFYDELNINGMLIAWIWYVFIMIIAIIFKERIGIWIFASIIFFTYRNNKLKGGN